MRHPTLSLAPFLLAGCLAGITPATAQNTAGHGAMVMGGGTPAAEPPVRAAEPSMMESMNKMNQAMSSAPMTGDPDHDFVVMMIPHHQGAIDMAKYELQHGKDPELRKLARDVVGAQNKEIASMKRWLAKHPAK